MILEYKIAGIPCKIEVTRCFIQLPSRLSAHLVDSDLDYHGYTEIEYEVLDRRGYPAPWLAAKVTDKINDEIEAKILEAHKEENQI